MQRRTFESPMDWEYQGTGPVDATSPFTQLARNSTQNSPFSQSSSRLRPRPLTRGQSSHHHLRNRRRRRRTPSRTPRPSRHPRGSRAPRRPRSSPLGYPATRPQPRSAIPPSPHLASPSTTSRCRKSTAVLRLRSLQTARPIPPSLTGWLISTWRPSRRRV